MERNGRWMMMAVVVMCVLVNDADSSHCAWENENEQEHGQAWQQNSEEEDGREDKSEEKIKRERMEDCVEDIVNITKADPPLDDFMRHGDKLRKFVEKKPIGRSESFSKDNVFVYLYKPDKKFRGTRLHASDTPAGVAAEGGAEAEDADSSRVHVDLPTELLEDGEQNSIVFCVINSVPQPENWNVLDGRVYGLSVSNKTIQGLQEPINITVPLQSINGTLKPLCAFYNFSNSDFSMDGCVTHWSEGDVQVICSCDHLTYFAILMVVRGSENQVVKDHEQSLTYITLIGCSISIVFLICTVLLFLIQRHKQKFDVSRRVHVNLAAALILLNGHFLPSSWVASLAAPAGCVYVALALHYSLLATLAWMAVEGFHLYMLLVRVFNIYIRRYLLKLALFAWGVPAVVVLLVYVIDRDAYGLPTASNSTTLEMCYVHNDAVKWVSVCVPVALLYLCNGAVLLVTVRQLWRMRASGASSGQDRKGACSIMGWKDACSIMALSCMLGVTWGIGLLSSLSLTAMYLFCILNSLQGVFISVWFFASRRSQSKNTESTTSTHTHT
ncbi:adhesion G-protein coupled receptor G5-like [Engraulis encrasicolus]|uniref:adhesion G-protein coupled receptor G5-like n=1 Tax=Engraulis encrasicolus TaxID=184585 RepID=UPI002FD11454